jgi:hypothetical protein
MQTVSTYPHRIKVTGLALWLVAGISLCAAPLSAQEAGGGAFVVDTVAGTGITASGPSEHRIDLAFEHVLSLYDWRGKTVATRPVSDEHLLGYDFELAADSRLRQETGLLTTSVTSLISARHRWNDDGYFTPFLTLFGTSYAASTPPGSLPPPSLIRRQIDGFAIAGVSSRIPTSGFAFSVGGGLARQSQPFASTYGTIVMASLDTGQELLSDSTLLLAEGSADERFFRERGQRYSNDRLGLRTLTTFGVGRNFAALSASLARRDFYYANDSASLPAKQERRELALLIVDSLRAPLFTPDVSGVVALEVEPRSITRRSDVPTKQLLQTSSSTLSTLLVPNDVSSFRISALAGFDVLPSELRARNFGAHAEVHYEERSEDVRLVSSEFAGSDGAAVRKFTDALEQASFSSRVTTAALSGRYAFGPFDTVSATGTSRLLNYDTPSQQNRDDHDELITGAELALGHRFSDALYGSAALRSTRSHLVYLKSDRSSQNNITRSLVFSSNASYRSFDWLTTLHAEVFSNYTVLDYLDSLPILQSVGSYVIRGLAMHDTTRIALPQVRESLESGLEFSGDLRVSERGSFNEREFSERRSTRVTELTTSALLAMGSQSGKAPWQVKGGLKGFFLFREGEMTSSLLSGENFGTLEKLTRVGPYFELDLLRSNGTGPVLIGSLWYSVLRSEQSQSATIYTSQKLESHLEVTWTF